MLTPTRAGEAGESAARATRAGREPRRERSPRADLVWWYLVVHLAGVTGAVAPEVAGVTGAVAPEVAGVTGAVAPADERAQRASCLSAHVWRGYGGGSPQNERA